MKFSLAVLAGTAAASDYNSFGSSIPQGFYGTHQTSKFSPSFPSSPYPPKPPAPTSSYHAPPTSHYQSSSHAPSSSHYPSSSHHPTSSHSSSSYPSSHHSSSSHSPSHSHAPHDPWNPHNGSGHSHYTPKPDGWWSATQQYSPPKIKFIPDADKPSFAICKINNANLSGDIQIAQLPWKPAQLTSTIMDANAMTAVDDMIFFRINELGRLMTADDAMCSAAATGDEFNPLAEKDYYGRPNPF